MELGEHLLQAWMVGLDKWLAKHWPASLTYSPGLLSIDNGFVLSLPSSYTSSSSMLASLSEHLRMTHFLSSLVVF